MGEWLVLAGDFFSFSLILLHCGVCEKLTFDCNAECHDNSLRSSDESDILMLILRTLRKQSHCVVLWFGSFATAIRQQSSA
jgi:hypothetical protein